MSTGRLEEAGIHPVIPVSSVALAPYTATRPSVPATDKPSKRAMGALVGILLAAMMAGVNNRVGALALADLRGTIGAGIDAGSWLTTAYTAGELIAMPFAAWFAITLSVRRFHLWMLGASVALAVLLPFVHALELVVALRFIQGVAAGGLIPVLMMAALKFLPPAIRLHGLALYALTATFAPNVSIWLAGHWIDEVFDWRWVYWQIIPVAILSGALVARGLPREAIQSHRFRDGNWTGMALAIAGLCLLTIALTQGNRLDWFNSALIRLTLVFGLLLTALYLLSEWRHPQPFIGLHFLRRRNLGLGFPIFVCLLVVMLSGALLPAIYLGSVQGYKPLQIAPAGLIIALPQLVLGSVVALLLYQKWVDARYVFATGLVLVALACLAGAHLTSDWNWKQFILPQILQAVGQPMAIVSTLFLLTSVVKPEEGPSVSGLVNALRVFGTVIGSAIIEQLITVRGRFHTEMLRDHAGLLGNGQFQHDPLAITGLIRSEALVLAVSDAYRVLGIMTVCLIPLVLYLTRIPAPTLRHAATPLPVSIG